jgi:hypothetical protein
MTAKLVKFNPSKFKKKLVSLIAILTVAITCFSFTGSAFAEGNESQQQLQQQQQQQQKATEMINTLDKYISSKNGQFEIGNIPASIYQKFGSENVSNMVKGVKQLNKQEQQGKITITSNKSVYANDDNSYYIQGGVNKTVTYWWGQASYMSTSKANDAVYALNNVAWGYTGAAVLGGYFTMGVFTLIAGAGAVYYGLMANSISHANSNTTRGVIFNITWAQNFWTTSQ